MASSAAKGTHGFHSGSSILNLVPVLILVTFGFVLGKIGNASFSPESNLSPVRASVSSSTPSETACAAPTPPVRMEFADFLAPSGGGLVHNMTDEELLWRASMEPRRVPHVSIVPKVAFLFLTQGALPLWPLWETFFNAQDEELYSIYVHASPGYADLAPKESVFYGRLIPSRGTSWGDMNLVDAERRLLATALLDLGNARFALFSESCIPLLGFPAVYAHLITGSGDRFHVESFYNVSRHGPFFEDRNISLAEWRKGSQWFEMDRRTAVELVAEEAWYGVFRGDHGVLNMEEHYLPTLVTLVPGWGARCENRTLTYVDWSTRGAHPRSFVGKGLSAELLEEMRRGDGKCGYKYNHEGGVVEFCHLFARKFAKDALANLLQLTPQLWLV